MTRPPRRWLSGFGLRDWGGDVQTYASLLDALTRDRVETEALEREMRIDADPQTVFEFFTDPAKMVRWKGTTATLDPRPGGVYRVEMTAEIHA